MFVYALFTVFALFFYVLLQVFTPVSHLRLSPLSLVTIRPSFYSAFLEAFVLNFISPKTKAYPLIAKITEIAASLQPT